MSLVIAMTVSLVSFADPPAAVSDLPMTPFVLGWVPADAGPAEVAAAAEAVLEHWRDPQRVAQEVYLPNPIAQLVAAGIALRKAADGGLDTTAAQAEDLWLL